MAIWHRRVPFRPSLVPTSRRRTAALLAGALLGVGLTLGAGSGTLQAADLPGSFRGSAFATFANATAGPVAAELGRSAYQPCPCRGTNGQILSNTINTLQAGE